MPLDNFADCLPVCCTSIDVCRAVEAETCTVGTQGASPSTSSTCECATTHLQWPSDEPSMPEVVGHLSQDLAVQLRPQCRSPLEIKSNLLRGVRTDVVLRGCASLLRSAVGSDATYHRSTPTDHLDAFISHNWSVSHTRKWLALCVHCNFVAAFFCGVLTAVALCVAESLGWLPLPTVEYRYGEYQGIYCCSSGFCVLLAVLLFGADLLPASFMRYKEVFLDKVCIHQVDKTLQRQGIESLGGFLFYSWSMVVLYTPAYTTKVWTVYEMACFLSVHPGGRLVWLPVDVLRLIVVRSLVGMLHMLFGWVTTLTSVRVWFAVPSWLVSLTSFPLAVCVAFILRRMALDQVKSETDLRQFSIKSALCAVEADRATVEGNVASLMRNLKLVASDSTHEEALFAFDSVVQSTMPRAVRNSVGRVGMRYEWIVVATSPLILVSFDMLGGQIIAGESVLAVSATILHRSILVFAIMPLAGASAILLCGHCTHLTGFKNVVFVLLVSVAYFFAAAIPNLAALEAHLLAQENIVAFALLCLVSVPLFFLTYLVFRRPPAQRRRRRTGAVSETLEELADALGSYSQQSQQMTAVDARRRSSE